MCLWNPGVQDGEQTVTTRSEAIKSCTLYSSCMHDSEAHGSDSDWRHDHTITALVGIRTSYSCPQTVRLLLSRHTEQRTRQVHTAFHFFLETDEHSMLVHLSVLGAVQTLPQRRTAYARSKLHKREPSPLWGYRHAVHADSLKQRRD
jgi:hypothetical protein